MFHIEGAKRRKRFFFSGVLLFVFFSCLTGCDFFKDYMEYKPGANLTFTGTDNTGTLISVSEIVVTLSGTGVSESDDSVFSLTGKIYSSFTGLEEGEYSAGVEAYDGSTLLARQGTTLYLSGGESMEVTYSLENIDGQVQIFFLETGDVSGEDSTSISISSAGAAFLFERYGWNGSIDAGEVRYAAYGDFEEASLISLTFPDGNLITMDRSRSVFQSSIYLEENQFLQAARRDYGESGYYNLAFEDSSGNSVNDSEYLNLTWAAENTADFQASPGDFYISAPPNTYFWTLSSSEEVGTLICMVINQDDTTSLGSVSWTASPGNSGSFNMASGSLLSGDGWIILLTLDEILSDTSFLDTLDDYSPGALASQILVSEAVNIDGIGIARQGIYIYN